MNWYIKCLKQYVDFSGRARRKEYWIWTLVNAIISLVFLVLARISDPDPDADTIWDTISTIYSLLVFLPGLAVLVRRLHDVDRSGWWILLILVPTLTLSVLLSLRPMILMLNMVVALISLVCLIVLIVWCATDSYRGSNRYGPNPKGVDGMQ